VVSSYQMSSYFKTRGSVVAAMSRHFRRGP
jgi:hypothetical protein